MGGAPMIWAQSYFMRMKDFKDQDYLERAERLWENKLQNRVDNFSIAGGISGFIIGGILGKTLLNAFRGSGIGVFAGVALHGGFLIADKVQGKW